MLSGQRNCGHHSSTAATTRSRLALVAAGAVVSALMLVPALRAFEDYVSGDPYAGWPMGPGGYDEA